MILLEAQAGQGKDANDKCWTSWQNCRYKLASPRVQAWCAWDPLVRIASMPLDDDLPFRLHLRCEQRGPAPMLDGGLHFETSYELSKVLAHASRDSDCLVLAYRCKTIPVSYNERDVVQIDRVTPLTLLSAGILAAPPNLSSAQARRMHEFAGRDVVLQQLFAFANAQPAGAGADPAADFGQDGSWVAKSIFW